MLRGTKSPFAKRPEAAGSASTTFSAGKPPAGKAAPRRMSVFMIAALAGLSGCDSQFNNVVFQTTGAASRTVADLALTAYANAFASLLAALQTLLTGS